MEQAIFNTFKDGEFTVVTVTIGDLVIPARYETAKAKERYGDVEAYVERLKAGILAVAMETLEPNEQDEKNEQGEII